MSPSTEKNEFQNQKKLFVMFSRDLKISLPQVHVHESYLDRYITRFSIKSIHAVGCSWNIVTV